MQKRDLKFESKSKSVVFIYFFMTLNHGVVVILEIKIFRKLYYC